MFACLAFLVLTTACRSARLVPPPMVISAGSWPTTNDAPDLVRYPIVDIHSHTFNAHYLPIENIALARRYDALPLYLGYLFPDNWVVHLARAIVNKTKLSEIDDPAGSTNVQHTAALKKQSITDEVSRQTAIEPKIVPKAVEEEELPKVKKPRAPREPTDREINKAASRLFKAKDVQKAGGRRKPIETPESTLWRFIDILTSNEKRLRRLLIEQEFPEVDLFVHHMMDLGPVYGQSPKGDRFLDFTNQISRSEEFDRRSEGKFIRFVAFSPFRATNSFEDAWRPVEQALAQGAWGIKIYPPSGYRPIGNKIPTKPWCPPILRQQWKSRYAGMTGKRLDGIMLQFFARCVERDIPVFAHCSYGEFQAAKGYGERNGNPKYWLRLFKQHPELQKLRLCLGHAGGSDYWLGFGGYMGWGADVVTLCTNYPNVYCEFGAMDGILGDENELPNSVYFANRMLDCFAKTDNRFAKKVMYGSDWFMPMAAEPRMKYLNVYREAFLTPQLRGFYKDFFCRNALDYLQMSEQRVDNDRSLSPAARDRLRSMLANAKQ